MKKIIPLIVIGLVFSLKIKSQTIKIPGKIIFLYTNDTINVTFNVPLMFSTKEPDYEKLQKKIKYLDSTGKKKVITPDEAKEAIFEYENEEVHMISCHNAIGLGNAFSTKANIFLKLEIDGTLRLFTYYLTQSTPGRNSNPDGAEWFYSGSYRVIEHILQKGKEEIVKPTESTFRKNMIQYFNDCPKLSQMIKEEAFSMNDLESIVDYYNSNCGK